MRKVIFTVFILASLIANSDDSLSFNFETENIIVSNCNLCVSAQTDKQKFLNISFNTVYDNIPLAINDIPVTGNNEFSIKLQKIDGMYYLSVLQKNCTEKNEEYEKKQRVNHCHHVIDAITIACIGKAEYDRLTQYYHDEERWEWGMDNRRAEFPKPWNTFTEDMKHLDETLLISHYTADNLAKQTRKKVRKAGKITDQYMQGDTARGSLHQDTYYGAIERGGEIRYVVRKPLDQLDERNVCNIVDDVVREKVEAGIKEYGSLKKAVEAGIWMNKDKKVAIRKVRVYAPLIKRPLDIRLQRDLSPKEYKRKFYVANDSNYMMGIYVGKKAFMWVKTRVVRKSETSNLSTAWML